MKKGFTLIELLTVIAIIGILVTVVTVNTSSARKKSRVNAAKVDVSAMLIAYESYKASHLSLIEGVANTNITNSGSGWYDADGTTNSTFWNNVDPNATYTPPSDSRITYYSKTSNGKGVFCAYGGDLDAVYLVGKSGNVFEGSSGDCAIP